MKKSLEKVLTVMLVIILLVTSSSLAATSSMKLTASKTSVMAGEEFTITVSLEGEEEILTIESLLDYNQDIFELKNKKIEQKGIDLGAGNDKRLDLAMENEIKSGNLFILTFAVKDGVSPQTSEIKVTEIKLVKEDYTILPVDDQVVSMNITEKQTEPKPETTLSKIEIEKAPNKVDYTEGEKFDASGLVINALYSDGTKKEVTNYTFSPNAELKKENKLITFSYQENGTTKSTTQAITVKAKQSANNDDGNKNTVNNVNAANNTNNTINTSTNQNNTKPTNNTTKNTTNNVTNNTANKTTNNTANTDASMTNSNLPKTGAETKYILLIVAGLIGVGFVSYIGYRKYKEI